MIVRKFALCLLAMASNGFAQTRVDLHLIFAVDISESVNPDRAQRQMDGLLSALQREDIQQRLVAGSVGQVALTYFEWGNCRSQHIMVPWMIIRRGTVQEDLKKFAQMLKHAPSIAAIGRPGNSDHVRVSYPSDATCIAGALHFARTEVIAKFPYLTERTTVDVSGDGSSNDGQAPDAERDRLVEADVTINGIPLLDVEPSLREYYDAHVVGGPWSFTQPSFSIEDYPRAIARKLVQEVTDAVLKPRQFATR